MAIARRAGARLPLSENTADINSIPPDQQPNYPGVRQQRTNDAHTFATSGVVGQPMLEHKAVHECHVAAEVFDGTSTDLPPAHTKP